MSTVRSTRELLALGFSHNELARQTRSGQLVHLRRGAYDSPMDGDVRGAAQHVRLVEATLRLTAQGSVVSHLSAAALHGLPVFSDSLGRVQLTRSDISGGKSRQHTHLHSAPLDENDIVVCNGVRTTSLARTVVDLGRSLPFDRAVMTGDAALRRGLLAAELERCLTRSARRPGVAHARRVVAFLDGRSESPGESVSRAVLRTVSIPAPTLQYEVRNVAGALIGRSDFAWPEQRTLGEFDGKVKYGQLLRAGETAQDVVYREKLREDALRDLGWQVVRWVWADLATPEVIADRLLRAFARAGH